MKFFSTELTILNNPADDVEQRHDLDLMLALVINKLFSNQSLINQNLIDINHLLIQIIDIIKIANLNDHINMLNDSIFSMIYNLTKQKMQSNECKYLDLCIVNDISDCLINYLGRLNYMNTVKKNFFITN